MSDVKVNPSRRVLLGSLGVSVALPSVWQTPLVSAVVSPVHAMTSPSPTTTPAPTTTPTPTTTPAPSCPAVVIDDVIITTPSPQDLENPVCGISFDIFSGDAMVPIQIVSIETTTLADNVTVTFDENLGEATMTDGIRVNWTGPAAGAPSCNATSEPFDDITFTITAECEPATSTPVTETITLLELYAISEFGNPV